MRLTRRDARRLLLAAQGLLQPPDPPATKLDVLDAIRRMGALQIDTIHVVARSPYLVLWSRLGHYNPAWLDELLAEGALFEYWSHAACFLPIEDYPLYRRLMLEGRPNALGWLEHNPEVSAVVLARVREGGEVRSAHFERTDGRTGGWWEWKPEKSALECLFSTGELMIARREKFQRVYDLRERVLPHWNDVDAPPLSDVQRSLTLKAVRSLGVTKAAWVPDYFRTAKRGIDVLLEHLAAEGQLVRVDVEEWDVPGYIHPDNVPLAQTIISGQVQPAVTTLLSPFDPVVWDRARAAQLFGFDYRIETYTPAAKRRYGYFSLPILRGDQLVGRLDAKAHRKEGRFEVRAIHLEGGVPATDDLAADLAATLQACARWHQTPRVEIAMSAPPELAAVLRRRLETQTGAPTLPR
jgi:uncharacterized protein YcaQ